MTKIIATLGLPGSTKSTWAKDYQALNPMVKRINKDDLRSMLDDSVWSKENKKQIILVRDLMIRHFIKAGYTVIVDDTNFAWIDKLKQMAEDLKVEFEVKDFTHVPVEDCIKNDLKRLNSVGKDVIMEMYNKYLKPKVNPAPEYDPKLLDCIIVDIDNTVALMKSRKPYQWDKVGEDVPNTPVIDLINKLWDGYDKNFKDFHTIVVSGRDEICREHTLAWLENNDVSLDKLYMRPNKDNRKDSIIKQEIYENHIKGKYNVIAVFDDRRQVCEMWRKNGLTVFQVAEGDF